MPSTMCSILKLTMLNKLRLRSLNKIDLTSKRFLTLLQEALRANQQKLKQRIKEASSQVGMVAKTMIKRTVMMNQLLYRS